MKSLRHLYKIGNGPSSSHTMGPEYASKYFLQVAPDADSYKAILYGSLALTGRGHLTDVSIKNVFGDRNIEVVFDTENKDIPHENTMDLIAYKDGEEVACRRIMSIGGGDIRVEGEQSIEAPEIYSEKTFKEIEDYCLSKNIRLSDYVYEREDEDIRSYLATVWQVMCDEIQAGLTTSGILPGGLNVERVAQLLYGRRHIDESPETRQNRIVCAYAFAAAEQNASCGRIVTAPTCGACAVVPAVLKYMQDTRGFTNEKIIDALAVGGLIGNIVKQNASISGAECGCQAEIGTACSMAAAALCELFEMGIDQIEYAAEMSMEHMLGLTCDPICGLVQIPCIERNAVAAMRALNALSLANFLTGTRKISFDMVVKTMYDTGKDLQSSYRETSEGGLAKLF
ncbi:MAG: L-serine ammonia-lyase, iron-sulfur-dependent, subunit alpha [Eubacteriales bacterium]